MIQEQHKTAELPSYGNEFLPGDRVRFNEELGTVKRCGQHAGTVFVFFDDQPDRAVAVSPDMLANITSNPELF